MSFGELIHLGDRQAMLFFRDINFKEIIFCPDKL
jgi:hypothetical protein